MQNLQIFTEQSIIDKLNEIRPFLKEKDDLFMLDFWIEKKKSVYSNPYKMYDSKEITTGQRELGKIANSIIKELGLHEKLGNLYSWSNGEFGYGKFKPTIKYPHEFLGLYLKTNQSRRTLSPILFRTAKESTRLYLYEEIKKILIQHFKL